MADLGKAYVQIMPSAKGISGSLSKMFKPEAADAGKKAGNSFTGSMMKVAGGLGLAKMASAGVDMIKNSMDGAIKRYDTIENSGNVFRAMKFSVEEADQVTQYFKKTLDGLPTGFDEAIKGTQSFAGATKDLDWSGKTWNALNNAVLAFGGTSEQTSRVTDALTKSFSSGKIGGDAFRSMIDNDLGPALQEMAERAGYNNLDELQGAFKNGTLSAEDFGEMLQDVSENGSASLDALEDVAWANVSGIGTAFGLISSRIVQGLEEVLRSTEKTLEKIGLPSIAEMTDVFSKGIRESIGKIGLGIEVLGDFIVEHKELFINAWEIMGGVIEGFKDLFTGNLTDIGTSFSETFDGLIVKLNEMLPTFIEKGLEIVSNLVDGITEKIPMLYEKGAEMMVGFYEKLYEFIPKLLNLAGEFVLNMIQGISEKMPEWITKTVEMVVTMAKTLGDNMPTILQKGAEMLATVAKGFRDNFPQIVSAAFTMITRMLTEIARNLPRLVLAGLELIVKLAAGLIKAIPDVIRAMGDVVSGITGAVKNISLFGAGRAIIDGFVSGLKNSWEAGKKFVGGIGSWIARNKGPISYDRKLLLPAGDAIMQGLDKGLQERFKGVRDTVGGMAGAISEDLAVSPTIDIGRSVARSNAVMNRSPNYGLGETNNSTRSRNESRILQPITLEIDGRELTRIIAPIMDEELARRVELNLRGIGL